MGLAGPRNRRKISVDPNNTKWTRDETTFGQKILRSQGWEPGKFLGAQGTAHAQLHSVASLAPIKINLKDDTLGLGAKIRQRQSDECTGLDVFKDLLGRLNGKTEETLNLERQVRSEIKTNLFVERRYGPMRFVRGGLLVGDQVKTEELLNNKPERAPTPIKEESTSEVSEVEVEKKEKGEKRYKKSKKRKASEADEVDTSESKRDKKRKKKPTKSEEEPEVDNTEVEKSAKGKKDKKEKKSKRLEAALEDDSTQTAESEGKRKKSKKSKDAGQQDSLRDSSTKIPGDATLGATLEKARKKEKKKDKKRKQADSIDASVTATTIVSSTTPQDSGSSTPNHTGTSTPQVVHARHLARSRNIASKRMAFKDMQALNQIFMIKPV